MLPNSRTETCFFNLNLSPPNFIRGTSLLHGTFALRCLLSDALEIPRKIANIHCCRPRNKVHGFARCSREHIIFAFSSIGNGARRNSGTEGEWHTSRTKEPRRTPAVARLPRTSRNRNGSRRDYPSTGNRLFVGEAVA